MSIADRMFSQLNETRQQEIIKNHSQEGLAELVTKFDTFEVASDIYSSLKAQQLASEFLLEEYLKDHSFNVDHLACEYINQYPD